MRAARDAFAVALLVALGLAMLSCDSFPAACIDDDDCGEGTLCAEGECVRVSPELVDRCDEANQTPELCNGEDDDCDERVDEGCTLGEPCQAGVGICAREGTLVEGPLGLICSVEPGPPGEETCNGLDDDCDSRTDEGCSAGQPCSVGVGLCRRDGTMAVIDGDLVCSGGEMGGRLTPGEPVDEVCGDRLDNDCDTDIDEGFAERLGQPCSEGAGICAVSGVTVCFEGQVLCSGEPRMPEPEICDRRDNDCDGMTDEDFGTGEACTAGIGGCETSGMTICNPAGDAAICNAVPRLPSAETCNGIDDDCNGLVDDGDDGATLAQVCGNDIGECRSGVQRCTNGRWSEVCEGGILPVEEQCDGRDNDCDGTIDQFDRPCGVDVGACQFGSERCVDGLWSECQGGIGPVDETCNGEDDDCDGVVDDAVGSIEPSSFTVQCGVSSVGECSFGVQICLPEGRLDACEGAVGPAEELCDGLDNDCDEAVDEAYARLGQPCVSGVGPCVADGNYICDIDGRGTVCDAVPDLQNARDEVCNGRDDDCDGRLDETFFLGSPCLDAGRAAGTCVCGFDSDAACEVQIDGNPVLRAPTERGGDNVDNDCDGRVDEA